MLDDLTRHQVVHYAPTLGPNAGGWEYRGADGVYRVMPVRGAVTVNGTDAYQAACLCGLGMIQAPIAGARALVDAGRLVEVLPDFTAEPMPVALLYPHRRQLAPRVQAVIAWLTQVVEPWLAETRPDDSPPPASQRR